MVYDSYKHYSKYPFDNYRIYIYFTVRGVIFLWYGILTREPGEPFTSSNQLQLLNQLRFTTKFTK